MPSRTRQRNYGRVRSTVATIAAERIEILLKEARSNFEKDPKFSRRYVELARKISTRTKVRIPSEEKRYLCKGCGLPLIPGRNARVRVLPGNSRIVITCLSCGKLKRYPFARKRPDILPSKSMKPYIAQSSAQPRKQNNQLTQSSKNAHSL
jgi:ribonuclease P protein subunit RPR2